MIHSNDGECLGWCDVVAGLKIRNFGEAETPDQLFERGSKRIAAIHAEYLEGLWMKCA